MARILSERGYLIEEAASGEEAFDLGAEHEFDLIITDVRLPGQDGLEALAQVRQLQPEVGSLVITGYSSEEETLRALRLGVGEYLNKPFRLEHFCQSVERLLRQQQSQRAQVQLLKDFRRVLSWCYEGLLQQSGPPWSGEALKLLQQLCAAANLEDFEAEILHLGCCLKLLTAARVSLPAPLQFALPVQMESSYEGDGLQAELIKAACCLAQTGQLSSHFSHQAREIARTIGKDLDQEGGQRRQARRLLSLATALEQSRDHDGALKAYRHVLEFAPAPEVAAAALGLARLARLWNRPQQVAEYCLKSLEVARQVGPSTLVEFSCGVGPLLHSVHNREFSTIMAEASLQAQRLQLRSHQAILQLVEAYAQNQTPSAEVLENLSRETGPRWLGTQSWWIIPWLLQLVGDDNDFWLLQILERSLWEDSASAAAVLRQGQLSATWRQTLLRLQLPRELLALLSQDELQESAAPAAPGLRIRVLGGFEVHLAGKLLPEETWCRNQKTRYLLTYLALHKGKFTPEDILADTFWTDEDGRARHNLACVRSLLRKVLSDQGGEVILKAPQGTAIHPNCPCWCDVVEFLQGWEQAREYLRSSDSQAALPVLRRLAQLYQGPFLEGCYLDWAVQQRDRLEAAALQAHLALAELEILSENWSASWESCQQALELDPCSQEAYRLGMQSLARLNRAEEAVRLFERCQRILHRELGIEPSTALIESHLRVRMSL